jgi:hypothetical protein
MNSPQRADIDDPALGGAQMDQRLTRQEKRPTRISLEDRIPLVEGEAVKRGRFKDSGVVHQHVKPPEATHGDGDGGSH